MPCYLKPIWFLCNKYTIVNTLKTSLQNPQRLRSHRLVPQKEESCVLPFHGGGGRGAVSGNPSGEWLCTTPRRLLPGFGNDDSLFSPLAEPSFV